MKQRRLPSHHTRPLDAIFRPALTLMTGRAIGFAVAFAIPMVLVRYFSQEEFGTYKQLFLIYGSMFSIAQLGMAESLFYFLPKERRNGGSYIFNALIVLAGLGLLCAVGLWLLRHYIAALMNNPDLATYVPYIGLYLMFMLIAVVIEIVMTVRKQHMAASIVYASTDMLRAVLYIAPVLIFADLHWLMLGAVGFSLVRMSLVLTYILREFGSSLSPNKALMRRHLGYAVPFGLAAMIEVVQGSLHMYAVAYHFDVATFAIYAVGVLQVPLFDFLGSSTCNVMMTNMREKLLEGSKNEACGVWFDAIRKLALVLFPLIACLLLLAYELIVLLFTATYEDSVPIFMIWTMSSVVGVLMVDGVLRVLAQTRFLIILNLVQLALIASTITWFISAFGLIGAILVSVFAGVTYNVLALARISHVLNLSLRDLLPWGAILSSLTIALAAMLPALLLKSLLDLHLLLILSACGSVYVLSYLVLLLYWGPMHNDEKRMLMAFTRMPFAWLMKLRQS